jgi:hypothetical protein
MPRARWFTGATLNYAEHALCNGLDDAAPAVVEVDETGSRTVTMGELRDSGRRRPPGSARRRGGPGRPGRCVRAGNRSDVSFLFDDPEGTQLGRGS